MGGAPSKYSIWSAAKKADLPSDKRALVIVALIDLKLHIRIFDHPDHLSRHSLPR
jgi:hypothetical protein